MGYYIDLTDSDFRVKKENFRKAIIGFKATFMLDLIKINREYKKEHFDWIDTDRVLGSHNIDELLKYIRYEPIYNLEGNICKLKFIGEKDGDEYLLFNALAPYVEDNSYLSFEGCDGRKWRYIFKNNEAIVSLD